MEIRNESNSSVSRAFVFVAKKKKKKKMKVKVCLRELKGARHAMLNNRSAPCMRDQKPEMFG